MAVCKVCFRHCRLEEGETGFCGARVCKGGEVIADNYGRITALALDPIEKKPLNRFYPGRRILSVGSYGCNLRCPFCQNYEISWSEEAMSFRDRADQFSPGELAAAAAGCRNRSACRKYFRVCAEPLTQKEMTAPSPLPQLPLLHTYNRCWNRRQAPAHTPVHSSPHNRFHTPLPPLS